MEISKLPFIPFKCTFSSRQYLGPALLLSGSCTQQDKNTSLHCFKNTNVMFDTSLYLQSVLCAFSNNGLASTNADSWDWCSSHIDKYSVCWEHHQPTSSSPLRGQYSVWSHRGIFRHY